MPKTKKEAEGGLGDWSSTGTFLRKPATGWLHEDRELMDGSSINYQVKYLGCVEVKQSMRTLQYNVRTQVTKEAVTRMAEVANRLPQNKRRKVPKQVNKLLGAVDTNWAGNMNLSISVDYLKISNAAGREIMNHSLPSISFASGGDGITIDFIGYVAKDPLHERACHVFECSNISQYVLTTIGQAFELRYKIYLSSPKAQPVAVGDSLDGNAWGSPPSPHTYHDGGGNWSHTPLPEVPPEPPSSGAGIYSDLPEFPTLDSPKTPTDARPRVYSKLPGFPMGEVSYENGPGRGRLENPYDTMGGARPGMQFSESGVYSNPGEVTHTASGSEDVYDNRLMTIRQQSTGDSADLIELTPRTRSKQQHSRPVEHEYGNTGLLVSSRGDSEDALYDNRAVEEAKRKPPAENMYDNPHYLGKVQQKMVATPAGMYDNPAELIGSLDRSRLYDNPDGALGRERVASGSHLYDSVGSEQPREVVYNNHYVLQQGVTNAYDVPMPTLESFRKSDTPRFDDTIYGIGRGGGAGNMDMSSLRRVLPNPLVPLPQQKYYHGMISRVEAEALIESDGEFLVRESSKKPGQFVLTGMAHRLPQHLLLMDRYGKVKSRDHEFESVPHLVKYFMEKKIPLVIGSSQVFLRQPIVNAFPTTGPR